MNTTRVFSPAARTAPRQSASANFAALTAFREEFRSVSRLREDLRGLRDTISALSVGRTQAGAVPTLTSQPLGLNETTTTAVLQSTEEINTQRDFYTPADPTFTGASTADPTLTDVYTGAADDVLTFTVTSGGTVGGLSAIEIEVRDGGGTLTDTIDIPVLAVPNTPYALSSGLTFRVSSGSLETGDSFQVAVTASTPASVNVDNPFNGSGAAGANLDPGETVQNGSFTINGESIAVSADDSIQSVLDRITNSQADVTAEFDAVNERVVLTAKTAGSSGAASISGDTSGFVQAVKLDTAVLVAGTDAESDRVLNSVAAFSAVLSGTVQVNGSGIAIDTAADSLNAIINRLNASAADVTVSLESGLVQIQSPTSATQISLDDGPTRFFETLGITTGTFEAASSRARFASAGTRQATVSAITNFSESLNDLSSGTDSRFRAQLNAITEKTGASPLLSSSSDQLAATVRSQPIRVREFFLSSNRNGDGLLDRLDDAFASRLRELQVAISEAGGSVVDVRA